MDGSSDWSNLTVDVGTGFVGLHSSLAVVDGRPAVSYYDADNLHLKYAWSSTADGSSGWNTLAVDALGSVGEFTSLAVLANGRPAISYYGNTDLKYAVLYE